jgi:hypothetical protein
MGMEKLLGMFECSSIVMGSGTNKVPTSMVKLLVTILDIESIYHKD